MTPALKARAAPSTVFLVHVNIGHLPAFSNLPGLNRIVVINRTGSAHFAQLASKRLHKPCTVDSTALHDDRRAVPYPVNIETGKTFVQDGPFQACCTPIFATIK